MNTLISHGATWAALKQHQQALAQVQMRDLFAQDRQRFEHFSVEACGLFLDYSKNRVTQETLDLLMQMAAEANLKDWIARMFRGEKINNTEQRAVLHVALRNRSNRPILVDGKDVMPEVNAVLAKMRQFCDSVRSGQWRGWTGKSIESVVNIGIGGSDLGPAMVTRALRRYHHPRLKSFFVSNLDSVHLGDTLAQVNPETTLFIIASKTFTTQETLLNAQSARQWLVSQLGDEKAVAKHFVAVSTATDKVSAFGIDTTNMFEFWDWVGGRYSLWSAIGLPCAVIIGMNNFEEMLAGAHDLDKHFETAPFDQNLPVLMGLLQVWYSSFMGASSYAFLPYDYTLKLFPPYLQQLMMESLGKRVTRDGLNIDYATGPVIWGSPGDNGQHAFYQLLHQGTQLIPADVIIALESQYPLPRHQEAVLSNALAQCHVLMKGRTVAETQVELAKKLQGEELRQRIPHSVFPGNQPTNMLVYQKLTPRMLGTLTALYEQSVFVQSVIWGINAFDQWGVELGKQVANSLLPELTGENVGGGYDGSTDGLLKYIRGKK